MSRILGRDEVARPLGVIDTLSAGYGIINRRLWLLVFPIGLDLLFWLGPKLSLVLLAGYLPLGSLEAEQAAGISEALAYANLLFLLALYVPTVLGKAPFIQSVPDGGGASRAAYQLLPEGLIAASVGLALLSLLVAAFYRGGIGQVVRDGAAGRYSNWLHAGSRFWWRLIVLHVAAALALLGIGVPWTLAIILGSAVSAELGSFLRMLFQVGLFWLAFYLFFTIDAVIVSDAGPMRAALASIRVVRANFWPAVGLIGLVLVIGTGLPIVWRALSGQPLGLVASIVANAYVGSGLVAAGMLFYRDRLRLLRGQDIGNY